MYSITELKQKWPNFFKQDKIFGTKKKMLYGEFLCMKNQIKHSNGAISYLYPIYQILEDSGPTWIGEGESWEDAKYRAKEAAKLAATLPNTTDRREKIRVFMEKLPDVSLGLKYTNY